jgi:hypothetical protein
MDLDGIGYFQELQAEKARIRSLASKTMSPAALARLPKPITIKRDVIAPVVLATKRDTTNPVRQEACRISGRKLSEERSRSRLGRITKRIKCTRLYLHNGRTDAPADRVIFDKIVDMAAAVANITPYEIHDFKRLRNIVRVRHVCWRLLREFTGLSSPSMARVTNRGCHTSVINGIGRALDAAQTVEGAAFYWELRTRLSASGLVIVDDLESKRGRKS